MEKDTRIGQGHWKGCHTFQDIICDGNLSSNNGSRDGGLRMGGTYWYYVRGTIHHPRNCLVMLISSQYQLDDEYDFHNAAEPSTTACPLLPGQLVNVLNVPISLGSPKSRQREGSVSSVSSTNAEHRTMDPQDKYQKPRQVPLPKLPRLTTSPAFLEQTAGRTDSPYDGSPISAVSAKSSKEPNSAATLRKFRLLRMNSDNERGWSISPTRRTGFRAAFGKLKGPVSAGPELESDRGRRGARIDREMQISEPVLLSRTDNHRVCVPIPRGNSNASSREQSPLNASAKEHSPLAQHPISPAQSYVSFREQSPLSNHPIPRAHPHFSSRNPSPIPRQLSAAELPKGQTALHLPAHIREQASWPASFHNHRKSRSRSREPSPLRNSLVSDDSSEQWPLGAGHSTLETLVEQNTPRFMPEALRKLAEKSPTSSAQTPIEKRLPTLPNSPSSVIEEDTFGNQDGTSEYNESNEVRSHFSDLTARSTLAPPSHLQEPGSHFSEWTINSVKPSPSSTYSANFNDQSSPDLSGGSDPSSQPSSPYHLQSMPDTPTMVDRHNDSLYSDPQTIPSVTNSCSSQQTTSPSSPVSDLNISGLRIGSSDDCTTPINRQATYFGDFNGFQGYKLPTDVNASEHTLRKYNAPAEQHEHHEGLGVDGSGWTDITQPNPHLTTMQQLMDELSYLGEMIKD